MGFGGHSITKESFELIRSLLPEGKTILELGSGYGTGALAQYYNMYSVEHNRQFVGQHNSTYIHAPLRGEWFDRSILEKELPKEYDFLLIDGPPTPKRRRHFLDNTDLFRDDVIWFFDDLQRPGDLDNYNRAKEMTGRKGHVVKVGDKINGYLEV